MSLLASGPFPGPSNTTREHGLPQGHQHMGPVSFLTTCLPAVNTADWGL